MNNIESEDVTISAIMRITNVSRDRIRKSLTGVKPTNAKRGNPTYRLAEAVQTIMETRENGRDRKENLQADVLEERLRRMKGESLDRAACVAVWGDKMKRLADAVKGADRLRHNEKRKLCEQLRHEVERMPVDLQECTFSDFDLPDQEADAGIEEPDTKTA